METNRYLLPTRILDFDKPVIKNLVEAAGWKSVNPTKRVKLICRYVKDQVKFGFSRKDNLIASRVLKDGFGHCNTKRNLLMALLRASDIPCRVHAFRIEQVRQKEILSTFSIELVPRYFLQSKVEVYLNTQWSDRDNYILDERFLNPLQAKHSPSENETAGNAHITNDIVIPQFDSLPSTNLNLAEELRDDFGLFDSPDEVYAVHATNYRGIRNILSSSI